VIVHTEGRWGRASFAGWLLLMSPLSRTRVELTCREAYQVRRRRFFRTVWSPAGALVILVAIAFRHAEARPAPGHGVPRSAMVKLAAADVDLVCDRPEKVVALANVDRLNGTHVAKRRMPR